MKKLSHVDREGKASMVDITGKPVTARQAVASATVHLSDETVRLIADNRIAKGNVLETARIAAIMGAKKTSELIPLCHPLDISSVTVDLELQEKEKRIQIRARVRCSGPTGVEMEALTAVSVAALTVYDMCKSVDKALVISDIMLLEKKGGKSGDWKR